MMPGPSNSDAAMDPTRTLEATTSTARKAPGGRADRRKQELNTTKTGNNVQRDVLDEEQVIVLTEKKKRSYTIEEKLRAVEYAMQTSTGAAARVLGYNRNTVQGWCRQTGQTRETALLMKCRHPVNL
ncbi:hypothetical protein AAVH_13381 [Aphelenchoides avenae]|nr:hypothetical protein AAVH_13381 [Aphelenchus avenae]